MQRQLEAQPPTSGHANIMPPRLRPQRRKQQKNMLHLKSQRQNAQHASGAVLVQVTKDLRIAEVVVWQVVDIGHIARVTHATKGNDT